jgi:hypothetical protein
MNLSPTRLENIVRQLSNCQLLNHNFYLVYWLLDFFILWLGCLVILLVRQLCG